MIWTRLVPEPTKANGGMEDEEVTVEWQVATDESMTDVVKEGTTLASPEHAHSVHVDVQDLNPGTEYYYQFQAGEYTSQVGRTQTAPAPSSSIDEFTIAVACCQNLPTGYFNAYHDVAKQEPDLVLHLGDYIYEGGRQSSLASERSHKPVKDRLYSLGDYRIRYACYKTDPDLQEAHAMSPWAVVWDDHEVLNNYAADIGGRDSLKQFLRRRANAYKAYWEHQPLRSSRMPDGPNLPLYRRFKFGNLVTFNMIDTRQYRDPAPYSREQAQNPDRTILGEEQRNWVLDGLENTSAQWNVLAQAVRFGASGLEFGGGEKWDGYLADRKQLCNAMAQQSDLNSVVLSGDLHRSNAYDLKADYMDPDSETVGTEYLVTSISPFGDASGNKKTNFDDPPWQKFWGDHRGYMYCTITPEQWQTDYRAVETVEEPESNAYTVASFVTEAGNPGAQFSVE